MKPPAYHLLVSFPGTRQMCVSFNYYNFTMSQDHWEYHQSQQRDKLLEFLKEYLNIHATPGADVSVIEFHNADDWQDFITWHNLNH